LAKLIIKCSADRLKSVETNEKFIEKGGFSSGEECSDDEEDMEEPTAGDEEKDF
jgi:hypothetical protein